MYSTQSHKPTDNVYFQATVSCLDAGKSQVELEILSVHPGHDDRFTAFKNRCFIVSVFQNKSNIRPGSAHERRICFDKAHERVQLRDRLEYAVLIGVPVKSGKPTGDPYVVGVGSIDDFNTAMRLSSDRRETYVAHTPSEPVSGLKKGKKTFKAKAEFLSSDQNIYRAEGLGHKCRGTIQEIFNKVMESVQDDPTVTLQSCRWRIWKDGAYEECKPPVLPIPNKMLLTALKHRAVA